MALFDQVFDQISVCNKYVDNIPVLAH